MRAMRIVISPKSFQLSPQIVGMPEEHMVKEFAAQGSDQPLDERVRRGHVRDGLDLLNFQDAQIRMPAVKPKYRIVIRTQIVREVLGRNRCVEYLAKGNPSDITGVHTETYDAPRELTHDHEYPVTLQMNGLAPEQVGLPEAVFRVPQERQP